MAHCLLYCEERPLPPYTYVPGVSPHPTSDPQGHRYGMPSVEALALTESNYRTNLEYLHAVDLFNHGYYWEAHEAWEGLWHAAGRGGREADFLKGLIKLAAAGVKLKEGRQVGVARHARRAAELWQGVRLATDAAERDRLFGLGLSSLIASAEQVAIDAQSNVTPRKPDAERKLPLLLVLDNPTSDRGD